MARENLARDDIAGLLLHLGKDCPGAISVLPTGAPPAKVPGDLATDYRSFTDFGLAAVVMVLHERRQLPDVVNDPSPNCGTGAPTTHILKVPSRSALSDPKLQEATMLLSSACGFETAEVQLITIAGIDVLLIKRFDRQMDSNGRIARLHQEDFAQALGLPPSLKYERYGATPRIFDASAIGSLMKKSAAAAVDRMTFIRATLFDLLTGNTDGHAKNHAILYLGCGKLRLAPRYDLLPTRLDASLSDELSFRIGTASTFDDISRDDLVAFLVALGLSQRAASRILAAELSSLAGQLAQGYNALDQAGLRVYANLIALERESTAADV
jgi:serine/threonine-protein kinase HipA